ncbi:CPBP family intramembrane glutamic endopeptidase [Gracilinema caldarium]|uniref:CPBP family intramembrane glutamic endopeptidase n=1 Tax=Gracilinema caldarium TaxID=215591 RepID=UPI0026EF4C9A|nr:type II CAAX endopeptidase family protein [Gracilinema caldarium]
MYWAFFLPSISIPSETASVISFVTLRELSRILLYDLPATALILFLLIKENREKIIERFAVSRNITLWAIINLTLIIASAFVISLLARFILPSWKPPIIQAPKLPSAWIVMTAGSFATAYLEESYFRLYLLYRFDEAGFTSRTGNLLSVLLFSLCHIYEGPLGFLNAAIAGLFFTLVYRKTGSIHSPAWAHGLYNTLVFSLAIL